MDSMEMDEFSAGAVLIGAQESKRIVRMLCCQHGAHNGKVSSTSILLTSRLRMEYSGSDTVAPLDLQQATIEENRKEEGNYQAHELEASIQPRDVSSLFEGAQPPYYHHHQQCVSFFFKIQGIACHFC